MIMTRARNGTGDYLKLNKRECSIKMELIPCGADMLKIIWDIGEKRLIFWASSVMGYQFSGLVEAIYKLYSEGFDTHSPSWNFREGAVFSYPGEDSTLQKDEVRVKTSCSWDGEGIYYTVTFDRKCKHWNYPSDGEDLVEVSITGTGIEPYVCTVDGHDLCYAVAKAWTEAIKTYGFYGYYLATGGNCNGLGDAIYPYMILFIKAYALNAMEARELKTVWHDDRDSREKEGTSFDREIELLLFDM